MTFIRANCFLNTYLTFLILVFFCLLTAYHPAAIGYCLLLTQIRLFATLHSHKTKKVGNSKLQDKYLPNPMTSYRLACTYFYGNNTVCSMRERKRWQRLRFRILNIASRETCFLKQIRLLLVLCTRTFLQSLSNPPRLYCKATVILRWFHCPFSPHLPEIKFNGLCLKPC